MIDHALRNRLLNPAELAPLLITTRIGATTQCVVHTHTVTVGGHSSTTGNRTFTRSADRVINLKNYISLKYLQ